MASLETDLSTRKTELGKAREDESGLNTRLGHLDTEKADLASMKKKTSADTEAVQLSDRTKTLEKQLEGARAEQGRLIGIERDLNGNLESVREECDRFQKESSRLADREKALLAKPGFPATFRARRRCREVSSRRLRAATSRHRRPRETLERGCILHHSVPGRGSTGKRPGEVHL